MCRVGNSGTASVTDRRRHRTDLPELTTCVCAEQEKAVTAADPPIYASLSMETRKKTSSGEFDQKQRQTSALPIQLMSTQCDVLPSSQLSRGIAVARGYKRGSYPYDPDQITSSDVTRVMDAQIDATGSYSKDDENGADG